MMREVSAAKMLGRKRGSAAGRLAIYRWGIELSCGHTFERERRQGDEIWAGEMLACPRCLVGERSAKQAAARANASGESTNRTSASAGWVNPSKLGGKCRWCDGEVAKPRRTFCSDTCVHEHRIRSDSGYARIQVWRRDLGVCAGCGMDTKRMVRAIVRHRARTWRSHSGPGRAFAAWVKYDKGKLSPDCELARFCRLLKLPPPPVHRIDTLWDCDHTTPVAEGGGECGMDNLRTLCVWCHRDETTKLQRRLARAKAREKQPELFSDAVTDIVLDEDGTGLG